MAGHPMGLADVEESQTRQYLFGNEVVREQTPRAPKRRWLKLVDVTRNNLKHLEIEFRWECLRP